MKSKSVLLAVWIACVVMIFSSCVARETYSQITYMIDNQTSFRLRYEVEIDEEITDLDIEPGEKRGIYSDLILGGSPGSPNVTYESWAEYIGKDIFLYRDSSGVSIEALKLNSEEPLNWIQTISDERKNTFEFELVVTDSMIE